MSADLPLPSHWNVLEAPSYQDWLSARDRLLTASDVSAVLGLNPYKSRAAVLRAKAGALSGEPERIRVVSAMLAGQFQEEGVFRWFLHDRAAEAVTLGEEPPTGSVVRNPLGTSVLVVHPDESLHLAASPDAFVVEADGSRYLVEVKVLGPEGSYLRWAAPCKSRAWAAMGRDSSELAFPVPHYVQLQTQMLCCGEDRGYVVGACGTKRLDHYVGKPDADLQARIEDAAGDFWRELGVER